MLNIHLEALVIFHRLKQRHPNEHTAAHIHIQARALLVLHRQQLIQMSVVGEIRQILGTQRHNIGLEWRILDVVVQLHHKIDDLHPFHWIAIELFFQRTIVALVATIQTGAQILDACQTGRHLLLHRIIVGGVVLFNAVVIVVVVSIVRCTDAFGVDFDINVLIVVIVIHKLFLVSSAVCVLCICSVFHFHVHQLKCVFACHRAWL
mmetsp:Transcript_2284/g.4431  ORF Transcript_2284/g.4431 Transcript_2284/m.4431 type:complete len:206 (-) Transcript_2284:111-728(-)